MPTTSVFSAVKNWVFRDLVLPERLLGPFRDPDQMDGTPNFPRYFILAPAAPTRPAVSEQNESTDEAVRRWIGLPPESRGLQECDPNCSRTCASRLTNSEPFTWYFSDRFSGPRSSINRVPGGHPLRSRSYLLLYFFSNLFR